MDFVTVGCRLPNGLVLEHPMDAAKQVTLNGAHRARIVGADYGLTSVRREFWEDWLTLNRDFPALKSGALFVQPDRDSAEAMGDELKGTKTGFDPLPQEAHGVKAVPDKGE